MVPRTNRGRSPTGASMRHLYVATLLIAVVAAVHPRSDRLDCQVSRLDACSGTLQPVRHHQVNIAGTRQPCCPVSQVTWAPSRTNPAA